MAPTPKQGPASQTTDVFVSYAHEDRKWLDPAYRYHLIPFLKESLRRQNVQFWFDSELKGGDEYLPLIQQQIDQSQIALLIVSQAFLNSEFIELHEMPRIADRAKQGQMMIVPVLVEPCDWSDFPVLADRQMVPGATPLIDFTESEAKWARVKVEILESLKVKVKRIRTAGPAPAADPNLPEPNTSETPSVETPRTAPVSAASPPHSSPSAHGRTSAHGMWAGRTQQSAPPQPAPPQPAETQPPQKSPSGLTWTDPSTGLMWAKQDNAKDVPYWEAKEYARNLRLDGYTDWRLPTIDELQGIHDPDAKVLGRWSDGRSATWYVKGNLQLTGWPWSSTPGKSPHEMFSFNFGKSLLYVGSSGKRSSITMSCSHNWRALCVRDTRK